MQIPLHDKKARVSRSSEAHMSWLYTSLCAVDSGGHKYIICNYTKPTAPHSQQYLAELVANKLVSAGAQNERKNGIVYG